MNVLKIAGMLMVMGASSLIGWVYSGREQSRMEDLQEFKKALVILKGQIRFALAPLAEAATAVAIRVRPPISEIFAFTSAGLSKDDRAQASEVWGQAVERVRGNCYFTAEDLKAFDSFGKNLGLLDAEMQGQAIDLLIEYIDQSVTQINENGGRQSRMYKSLGFLTGVLISIIFL